MVHLKDGTLSRAATEEHLLSQANTPPLEPRVYTVREQWQRMNIIIINALVQIPEAGQLYPLVP